MKKWMNYVLVMGLTAGTASAAWWPFGGSKSEETAPAPAPAVESVKHDARPRLTPEQIEKRKARKEARQEAGESKERQERMAKRKAIHEELKQLGEAARNESDPVRKQELVEQLRTRLTQISDEAIVRGQKKLEKAEKELKALQDKLANMEKNKSARIEEKIQRILAGEPMKGPDGKRQAKEGGKQPEPPASE